MRVLTMVLVEILFLATMIAIPIGVYLFAAFAFGLHLEKDKLEGLSMFISVAGLLVLGVINIYYPKTKNH
jgi:hypothetical protein